MKETIRVDLPKEVHKRVRIYAAEHDLTLKEAYKELVEVGLKNEKKME